MSDDFEDLVSDARAANARREALNDEQARKAQANKRRAENEHDRVAKKFISAIRSRGIQPLPVFKSAGYERYRKWSWTLWGFYSTVRELPPNNIGEGWIIQQYRESSWERSDGHVGIVLMTDGRVLVYDHLGANKDFKLPEPHVLISNIRPTVEGFSESFLSAEGSEKMLAEVVVAHEQGKLKSPNQQRRRPLAR